MSIASISYKSKINATIDKLPLSSQPLFQAALTKHSLIVDSFSSNGKETRNKNKSRNANETFTKKYLNNKETPKTFSKKSQLFENLYNKIKRNNKRDYGREVKEDNDQGHDTNDLSISDNIFLPSIILEKAENINSIMHTLDKNEINKEKELVEKYSNDLMKMKKNNTKQQYQISHLPFQGTKIKKESVQLINLSPTELYDENQRLIKDIYKSSRTYKSLSEIPEYCITTVDTKDQINIVSKAEMPLLTSPQMQSKTKKCIVSSNKKEKKPHSNNKIKQKPKIGLSDLYNRILINQLSQEHKNITKYFKYYTKQKTEPVNFQNGSNLHGLVNDLQIKTTKVNIPEKTGLLINKYGSNGIDLNSVGKIEHIDQSIRTLNYDYMTELLYK